MRRQISRYGAFACLLVLMLVVVGGSSLAAAKGKQKTASLKISIPASVVGGANFKVKASGYSGKYNSLLAVAYGSSFAASSCPPATNFPSHLYTKVSKNHTFNVKLSPTQAHPSSASNPGIHTVCVFLFNSAPTSTFQQIVKSKHYQVT